MLLKVSFVFFSVIRASVPKLLLDYVFSSSSSHHRCFSASSSHHRSFSTSSSLHGSFSDATDPSPEPPEAKIIWEKIYWEACPIFISFFFAVRLVLSHLTLIIVFLCVQWLMLLSTYRPGTWLRKYRHLKPVELFGLLISPLQILHISCHFSPPSLS